jgi:hypothetical protein
VAAAAVRDVGTIITVIPEKRMKTSPAAIAGGVFSFPGRLSFSRTLIKEKIPPVCPSGTGRNKLLRMRFSNGGIRSILSKLIPDRAECAKKAERRHMYETDLFRGS